MAKITFRNGLTGNVLSDNIDTKHMKMLMRQAAHTHTMSMGQALLKQALLLVGKCHALVLRISGRDANVSMYDMTKFSYHGVNYFLFGPVVGTR